MANKRVRLTVLAALGLATIAGLLSLLDSHLDEVSEWVIPSKPWVHFDVPRDAQRMDGTFHAAASEIIVCNRSPEDWREITIRVSGTYNAQYFAKLHHVKSGACETTKYSQFAEPSWKKMEMPPSERATKADLITSVPAHGYAQLRSEAR